MTSIFGILALLAGIVLLFTGQPLMGISGSIVGAGLAIQNIKTIKEIKKR